MPSLLQRSATWLGERLTDTDVAGQPCTYFRGQDALPITLVPHRSVQPKDGQFSARLEEFSGVASDLVIVNEPFVPSPFDEIEWTDTNGHPLVSIVFPRPRDTEGAENCYRFPDPGKKLIRIYTVDQASLISVSLNSGGETYNTRGVPAVTRGSELFDRDTTKLLTTSVYIPRSEFIKFGIETPPIMASVDALGLVGWAVNMTETEWGDSLVRLGLHRETLVREWQARRAAV